MEFGYLYGQYPGKIATLIFLNISRIFQNTYFEKNQSLSVQKDVYSLHRVNKGGKCNVQKILLSVTKYADVEKLLVDMNKSNSLYQNALCDILDTFEDF